MSSFATSTSRSLTPSISVCVPRPYADSLNQDRGGEGISNVGRPGSACHPPLTDGRGRHADVRPLLSLSLSLSHTHTPSVSLFFPPLRLNATALTRALFRHRDVLGFGYPMYQSLKALETTGTEDDRQWLTYWLLFAMLKIFEGATGVLLNMIPFYLLIKVGRVKGDMTICSQ